MNFEQWSRKMKTLQIQAGRKFENALLRHFEKCGNRVEKDPVLANGRTPDFLLTDHNGISCYVEAKFLMWPRDIFQYARNLNPARSWIKPHLRDRIFEKVESDIASKYPSSVLNGLPLVIAIFDYSTVDIVDFEGELCTTPPSAHDATQYGHRPPAFWDPNPENPVTITNIQAVWQWIPVSEFSSRFGSITKPVLYTNPYNQIALPGSLTAFNRITWSQPINRTGIARAVMIDGGASYDFEAIEHQTGWRLIIEESRLLGQQVRNSSQIHDRDR